MDAGECSAAKEHEGRVWAKLVPMEPQYSEIDIKSEETAICSAVCSSSDVKRNWCVITKAPYPGAATIKNISKDTIFVDDAAVEVGGTMHIECGSEIISGPHRKGNLVFTFKAVSSLNQGMNIMERLMIPLDLENPKCSICLNVWHDVVTIAPCFHNFCNGCFSEWLRRSEKKFEIVLCPLCRATVHCVGRNHFLHNIEKAVLEKFPSSRRSDEELASLDRCASIRSNLVLESQRVSSRKRPISSLNDEVHINVLACPQCGGTSFDGFRCDHTTAHLQCRACWGLMPSRPDTSIPQHCIGCENSFCGAYWHAQGLEIGGIYAMCGPETFKPASVWSFSGIPNSAHENNCYEQEITEKCIRHMGKTFQAVILEWIEKFDNRELGNV